MNIAVVQSEFFTMPSKDNGVYELSMEKGLAEHPDHVVFNGKAGALTGEGELKAERWRNRAIILWEHWPEFCLFLPYHRRDF